MKMKKIGSKGKIHVYEKFFLKSAVYGLSNAQRMKLFQNMDKLEEQFYQRIHYKKGVKPKLSLYHGYIRYSYPGKPKIFFSPYDLIFYATPHDFKKYGREACHNQAHFLVQSLTRLRYMNTMRVGFRMRPNLTEKQKEKARKEIQRRRGE